MAAPFMDSWARSEPIRGPSAVGGGLGKFATYFPSSRALVADVRRSLMLPVCGKPTPQTSGGDPG